MKICSMLKINKTTENLIKNLKSDLFIYSNIHFNSEAHAYLAVRST